MQSFRYFASLDNALRVFADFNLANHRQYDHEIWASLVAIIASIGSKKHIQGPLGLDFDSEALLEWLKELDSREAFFVIRMKSSILTEVTDEYDITDQKAENLLSDEDILFLGQQTSHAYASELRCVKFLDYDDKEVIVVTNNFQWSASTVQDLYKNRWAIETFFREVKQNLSIKSFCGTSYNAVMIQVWTTMIAMLMIKYLKKRATYKWSTANLVHQLRIHLLVKIDLQKWIDEPLRRMHRPPPNIQLEISF